MKTHFSGSCHCGNISVHFNTQKTFEQLAFRKCECSFCVPIDALYCADPDGKVDYFFKSPSSVGRYTFGLKTADFIFCRICSSYMGAIHTFDGGMNSVVNIKFIPELCAGATNVKSMNFDAETKDQRVARRQKYWTPASVA